MDLVILVSNPDVINNNINFYSKKNFSFSVCTDVQNKHTPCLYSHIPVGEFFHPIRISTRVRYVKKVEKYQINDCEDFYNRSYYNPSITNVLKYGSWGKSEEQVPTHILCLKEKSQYPEYYVRRNLMKWILLKRIDQNNGMTEMGQVIAIPKNALVSYVGKYEGPFNVL